jgi:hypothetical protein
MRKKYAIGFILFVAIICSSCSRENAAEMEVTKKSEITDAPVNTPTVTIAEKETAFTDGVLIKKYPDNYACFKLESPEGYQIVCDPFNMNETLQPDIVIESHQHADHNDTSSLELPYQLITEPGEYKTDDVIINGYAGKHNKGDKEDTNYIFVIKLKDITIAHFASQGELPSNEVLEQIGNVDILLIQIFTNPSYAKLIPDDADVIISKLNPKIIIPEHGGPIMGDKLAKHLKVSEEVENPGSIIITRDMLDNGDGIRVINLDN